MQDYLKIDVIKTPDESRPIGVKLQSTPEQRSAICNILSLTAASRKPHFGAHMVNSVDDIYSFENGEQAIAFVRQLRTVIETPEYAHLLERAHCPPFRIASLSLVNTQDQIRALTQSMGQER